MNLKISALEWFTLPIEQGTIRKILNHDFGGEFLTVAKEPALGQILLYHEHWHQSICGASRYDFIVGAPLGGPSIAFRETADKGMLSIRFYRCWYFSETWTNPIHSVWVTVAPALHSRTREAIVHKQLTFSALYSCYSVSYLPIDSLFSGMKWMFKINIWLFLSQIWVIIIHLTLLQVGGN